MGVFDKLKKEVEEKKPEAAPEKGEPRPEKSGREKPKKPAQNKVLGRARQSAKLSAGKTKTKEVVPAEEPKEEPKKEPKAVRKPEKSERAATEGGEPRPQRGREEPDFEGELAIDVYETDGDFVIQSTIAGVKAEDLDITIENDIVTIRGSREKQVTEEEKKYYYQECYWGAFSRQVILPEEVDGSKAEAAIKEGVLTLRIPKAKKIQKRKVSIKQEE